MYLFVDRLPARLRRKSVTGPNGEPLPNAEQEPVTVGRMRAPIKTTTAPVAAVNKVDPLERVSEPATDSLAARKRVLVGGVSVKQVVQRERSAPVATSSSQNGGVHSRARFMAPTASSRMAAAQKQAPGDVQQRSAKSKTAPRRPASGKGNNDLHDLQELLARHNKKFKSTHTYQPPQHSVRDVRVVRSAWIDAILSGILCI